MDEILWRSNNFAVGTAVILKTQYRASFLLVEGLATARSQSEVSEPAEKKKDRLLTPPFRTLAGKESRQARKYFPCPFNHLSEFQIPNAKSVC
jgi:hypothetical protein